MSFHYPISGGKAEKAGKTPSDFNPKAIKKGVKVEKEHTPDKRVATGITIDHLTEDEKYYDYLDEMEKKMKTAMWNGFYDEMEKLSSKNVRNQLKLLYSKMGKITQKTSPPSKDYYRAASVVERQNARDWGQGRIGSGKRNVELGAAAKDEAKQHQLRHNLLSGNKSRLNLP